MTDLTRKEADGADYRLKEWVKKDRRMTDIKAVNARYDRIIELINLGVSLADAEDMLAQELRMETII
jgi:hypothetical protein